MPLYSQSESRNLETGGSLLSDDAVAKAYQARLAAIVESSDDAIVSKNVHGIVQTWNSGAERIFGWTAQEMIGSSILKIIPPELRDEEERIIAMVRAGQKVDHFLTTRLRKDGRRIHVSITVSPVRDDNGRIIGASKIARDISDQREGDRARSVLAAIVESSDDAIISKDLDGVVTSWNRAAERLYGYTSAEMIGQPVRKIIPADLQSEEDDILAAVRAGRRIEHFETTRLAKDGHKLHVSITVSPVRDGDGRIIGASKIARDISAQREAQREKDRFLAILAHELRNPLAPIRNAIMLFGQPGITEEGRNRAREIAERQVAHMAQLLDDLLDVARISTGRVELKTADMPLQPLIDHAVETVQPALRARRHVLTVAMPGEEIWINADAVRILQIVTNLLTNASKYTDPGGKISLEIARDGDDVVIEVRDNGIGFDPRTGQRLFKLFSQATDATARSDGGLGIGLALVREFVERHHGTVVGMSEGKGKGSLFRVRLPAIKTPG
jgi:PAS domain S-box-containing protein